MSDEFDDMNGDEHDDDIPTDTGALTTVEEGYRDPTAPYTEGEEAERRDEAQRLAQLVRDLRERTSEMNLDLARAMHDMKANALYLYITNEVTGEPYASFADYVAEEVDGGLRRADYYAQIWRWFAVQFGEEFMARMSVVKFYKLKELAGLVTPDTAQGWIELALDPLITTTAFKAEVSAAKKKMREDKQIEPPMAPQGAITDPLKNISFKLDPDQLIRVNRALAIAQEEIGSDLKADMLLELCDLYYERKMAAREGNGEAKPLINALHELERTHSVRVVVIDPKTNEIVHGGAALEEVLASLGEEDEEG